MADRMTPTADALKGLVGALRAVCLDKNGQCKDCGMPPETCAAEPMWCAPLVDARAALAAFESRGRLRDDAAVRETLMLLESGSYSVNNTIDWLERHLFGSATTPTQEERER